MASDAFTLVAPALGALDLPPLTRYLDLGGEVSLTREEAERKIAIDRKRLETLRQELENAPAPTYPPDSERWNPYPRLDEEDEDEPVTPAERIAERIGEVEERIATTLRRSGRLPVNLNGAEFPTETQLLAIARLASNPDVVFGPLEASASYEGEEEEEEVQDLLTLEELTGEFFLTEATISRWESDHAFVHVGIQAVGAEEHGLFVILREGEPARYGTADVAFENVASDPAEVRSWQERENDPAYRLYDEAGDASMGRDLAKMRTLVAQGVDLNYPFEDGYSPLWHAINEYDVDMVEFLLASGADPSRREDGKTALGTARELFTQLSWTEKPKGLLGRGLALFAKHAGPRDEGGESLGAKELRALKTIIPMLESRMGLRPTRF